MTLAPMTLPTDMADCFLTMEAMAVTSSGSEVPMATMVTPMMASETPQEAAMSLPLLTSSCDPATMPAAPPTMRRTLAVTVFRFTGGRSPAAVPSARRAERMFSAI